QSNRGGAAHPVSDADALLDRRASGTGTGARGACPVSQTIEEFRITRYQFPRSRPIGDSQVRSDWHYMGTLELTSSRGQVGLGFFGALFHPLPPLVELERVFRAEVWPNL